MTRPVRLNRALKGRLGHCTRPEGRDQPFRARAFAEPALQRTDYMLGSHFFSVTAATTRTPPSRAAAIASARTPNGNVVSALR
jgi:hypothetical protein